MVSEIPYSEYIDKGEGWSVFTPEESEIEDNFAKRIKYGQEVGTCSLFNGQPAYIWRMVNREYMPILDRISAYKYEINASLSLLEVMEMAGTLGSEFHRRFFVLIPKSFDYLEGLYEQYFKETYGQTWAEHTQNDLQVVLESLNGLQNTTKWS